MSRIILHGELAEKFNNEYRLNVKSPSEALRALCLMVPKFKETFAEGSYYIYIDDKELINIDEENFTFNSTGDIHFLPEIVGAKKHGLGKVLAGLALVALTFVPGVNVAVLGAVSTIGLDGAALMAAQGLVMHTLFNVGMALALGGAAQMLAPKPKNDSTAAQKNQSFIFNGADLNIQNGSAVPIIVGEVLAAGFPISQEITDAETSVVTSDPTYNTSVGGWSQTEFQGYSP
jgi:predicted phage tail protein